MAGLKAGAPTPQSITVHEQSRVLEVVFSDGVAFRLPFELLRVYSPSAEVMGHGPGQEVLQAGKRDVTLVGIEPVGNYAVQPAFSDGHDSGIFSGHATAGQSGAQIRIGLRKPLINKAFKLYYL